MNKLPFEIVEPSFEVISPSIDAVPELLRQMENVARTCYQSQDKATSDPLPLLTRLRDSGHTAMLEFGDMAVRFLVDRGVSHEIVRHRLCSFAQESTRYCDYDQKGIRVICPPGISHNNPYWLSAMEASAKAYKDLRDFGAPAQIARSVLPTCLATEIVVKADFTEWRHIFRMRALNPKAHPQMREVMIPLLRAADRLVPVMFSDLVSQLPE